MRQELTGIAAQWRDMGIDLGIPIGKLNQIQAEVEGSMPCLTQMLTTWLRRAYNVERFGEPTWRKLVEVVGSPSGGNNPSLSWSITERHQAESVSAGEITKTGIWGLLLCYVICSIPTLPVYKCTFVLYICICKQQAKVSSLLAISSK